MRFFVVTFQQGKYLFARIEHSLHLRNVHDVNIIRKVYYKSNFSATPPENFITKIPSVESVLIRKTQLVLVPRILSSVEEKKNFSLVTNSIPLCFGISLLQTIGRWGHGRIGALHTMACVEMFFVQPIIDCLPFDSTL